MIDLYTNKHKECKQKWKNKRKEQQKTCTILRKVLRYKNWLSEAVNQRRTDNTMVQKRAIGQTAIY